MPLIRMACPADLGVITAITNDAIRTSTALWSTEVESEAQRSAWLAARRAAGLPVLVAELDGEVTGFASYAQFRPHGGYRHSVEHSLYVAAHRRGRGIGGALLAALIDVAVDQGMHVIVGGLEATNHASIALHQRHGFVEVGRMPEVGRKFDRWLDLVWMQRILPGR